MLIALLALSNAFGQCAGSPLVLGADTYVIAHESDLHADAEWQTSSGSLDEWDIALNRGGDGLTPNTGGSPPSGHMGAQAYLWTGDLSTSIRASDTDGDHVSDCSVTNDWTSTCAYPSPYLGNELLSVDVPYYASGKPIWALEGNHDGSPIVPSVSSLDTDDEWWRTYVRPLAQGVVDEGPGYMAVSLQMTSGTWWMLLLSDRSLYQDRAIGGRCDLVGTSSYSTCSTYGWPEGVLTQTQYDWLGTTVDFAYAHGYHVLVATHQPPAKTTVATWAAGEAYANVCPGHSGGVILQSSDTASHHPRETSLLPSRTDLDGSPSVRDTQRDWSSALLGPGTFPDTDWWATFIDAHPGITLWLAGHNHLPVPDLTYNGHGVTYTYNGTTVAQVGAMASHFCTTTSACPQQAAKLTLNGDGSWSWERWDMGAAGLVSGCTTSATVPAGTSHVGAWGNIGIITGGPYPN